MGGRLWFTCGLQVDRGGIPDSNSSFLSLLLGAVLLLVERGFKKQA